MRRRLAVIASFATFGVMTAAHAEPAYAADADTERARALFDEAGDLERRAQWGPAQERLRAALRLRETPQLHYALGWALEANDKLLEAKVEYETAVRLGRDGSGGEEAARLANARLAELERNTPQIHVRTSDDPRLVRIIVDGRETKREDDGFARSSLDPGSHVVRVERGGAVVFEQVIYVGRGATSTVDVGATNASVASTRTGPTTRRDDVLPWVLVGGGAALAATGTALLVSSSSDANDARQGGGVVLVGSGVIAAAVGAVLLLRGDGKTERNASRARVSGALLRGGAFATTTFSF